MGKTLNNQNAIHEEIKIRLNSLLLYDADLLSSNFLSRIVKIEKHRNAILPVWLWNLVTHVKGEKQTEVVQE